MKPAVAIRTDLSSEALRSLARNEENARVTCKLLALAHALDGVPRGEAARLAGMDRQALRNAVHRYNSEGVSGLYDRCAPGRIRWLSSEEEEELREIILKRPDLEQVGRAEWTLSSLCETVIAGRFGKTLHPASLSRIVRRLGLTRQKTRQRHPKSNEKAQEAFKKRGLRDALMETTALHKTMRVEIWFQDEGRFGQMGRLAHRWWLRGERPLGLCDRRFASTYIYAAVCPETGDDFALVMPKVNTKMMNAFLDELSTSRPDNVHVILVLDRAGWHRSKGIKLPPNITLVPLPPYSPELNPVERLWLYLRERYYSHRVLNTYNDIVEACCHAWMSLVSESGVIHSLTSYSWLPAQCNNL